MEQFRKVYGWIAVINYGILAFFGIIIMLITSLGGNPGGEVLQLIGILSVITYTLGSNGILGFLTSLTPERFKILAIINTVCIIISILLSLYLLAISSTRMYSDGMVVFYKLQITLTVIMYNVLLIALALSALNLTKQESIIKLSYITAGLFALPMFILLIWLWFIDANSLASLSGFSSGIGNPTLMLRSLGFLSIFYIAGFFCLLILFIIPRIYKEETTN